jgi:hypothetical protein
MVSLHDSEHVFKFDGKRQKTPKPRTPQFQPFIIKSMKDGSMLTLQNPGPEKT